MIPELSDQKTMGRGSRFEGRIPLARTWAHTQWRPSAHCLFLFFLAMYLRILSLLFVQFRTQSYISKGLDINLYEEKSRFDKQNARVTNTGVETLLQRLGRTGVCFQVPSAFLHFSLFKFRFSWWKRDGWKIYSNHELGMMKMVQIYNLRMILSMFLMMDD